MSDYETATSFLGEWGRFQQEVFFLLCLSVVPNGFAALSIIFVGDTPSHRCLIPVQVTLNPAWRNSSIPLELDSQSGELVPSSCLRYKLEDVANFSNSGVLPGVDVDLANVSTESCKDGWEYDRSVYGSTIVTEWDLVCDDSWKYPLTSSIFFGGVFTGSLISGQFSDRYGRKIVLFTAIGVQTMATFLQVFSQSWIMFCTLHFIAGMGAISKYIVAFVLGAEILGPRVRTVFSTAGVSIFFGFGYMLLPLLAFFIRDWRMLLISLVVPQFLCVPLWWIIPESPRWLLSQGRIEEAESIIRNAAKRNKIQAPSVIFSPLQLELQSEEKKAHNICDLLRSPNIRWLSVTLWLVWNTVSIGYYALSLNTGNLHGNVFFNCFLSGVVEIPAYTLSWFMFRCGSRRLSLFSTLFMGGVFLLLQLITSDQVIIAVGLEMMGKFSVTTAFAVVYAYTAELYPTVLRNTAVGTCSMASRVGSIIAPYFIYLRSYSVSLPYILTGSLTALVGLLSLLLPETRGMPLPDTITHMQHFPGCRQKKPHTTSQVEEKENSAEIKSLVV